MFSAPFLSILLHRVKAVVRRVARPGPERVRAAMGSIASNAVAPGTITPALRGLARGWMRIKLQMLWALMRRVELGKARGPRAASPRTAADRSAVPTDRLPVSPEDRLPRGFGWMIGLDPGVREDGVAFAAWLNEPATKAMVLASPEAMARVISPILTAVGACRPAWFPAVRRGKGARSLGGRKAHIVFETDDASSPVLGSGPGTIHGSRPLEDGGDVAGDRPVKPNNDDCIRVTTTQVVAKTLRSHFAQDGFLSFHDSSARCRPVDIQDIYCPEISKTRRLDARVLHGLFVTIS
jgi:hypothetical protein